jgi:hypothetical protein
LEIRDGLNQLANVIRYAALIPYTTVPKIDSKVPEDIPFPQYSTSKRAASIDLRGKETLNVLENLYLTPVARLKAPFIPQAVPFGTDVVRPSMSVLAEESSSAARVIETAVQKYAANAISADAIEAASAVLRSPFLKHLTSLRENWARRSAMEDSESPRSLNFRLLNSGLSGGYSQDYLGFLDNMDRLRKLLEEAG